MRKQKKLLKVTIILLLALAVYFVAAEQIVRVEMFGSNAFSPKLMENIQGSRSEQLHANACYKTAHYDAYFKGAHTQTNYLGLRDQVYALNKSKDTFRIAVIGDSTTTGIGVEAHQVYHSLFEIKLNAELDKKFEVMEFGKGGIQNPRNHHCYFKKINDAFHFDPDMTIIQLYNSYDNFLKNTSNIQQLEQLTNHTYVLLFIFEEREKYPLKTYTNTTNLTIVNLNVTKTNKDNIYPADWHPNANIHSKYADALFSYFEQNKDYFYQQTDNLTKKQNLTDLYIPKDAFSKDSKSGFWESYYLQKIQNRYDKLLKKTTKSWKKHFD